MLVKNSNNLPTSQNPDSTTAELLALQNQQDQDKSTASPASLDNTGFSWAQLFKTIGRALSAGFGYIFKNDYRSKIQWRALTSQTTASRYEENQPEPTGIVWRRQEGAFFNPKTGEFLSPEEAEEQGFTPPPQHTRIANNASSTDEQTLSYMDEASQTGRQQFASAANPNSDRLTVAFNSEAELTQAGAPEYEGPPVIGSIGLDATLKNTG